MRTSIEKYPEFIRQFSRITLPNPEVEASLLDGEQGQVVFFDMPEGAEVPMHQHDDSWAVVISGELKVTVGGQTFNAQQGDSWFTPGNTPHGGVAMKRTRLMEVFSEKRY